MAINVTARHMDASEGLQEYARSRGEQIEAEFPNVENVHLILDSAKRRYSAHIVVQAKHHVRLEAEEDAETLHVAMDAAVDKISTQLRRAHDKAHDHKVTMKHSEQSKERVEGTSE